MTPNTRFILMRHPVDCGRQRQQLGSRTQKAVVPTRTPRGLVRAHLPPLMSQVIETVFHHNMLSGDLVRRNPISGAHRRGAGRMKSAANVKVPVETSPKLQLARTDVEAARLEG